MRSLPTLRHLLLPALLLCAYLPRAQGQARRLLTPCFQAARDFPLLFNTSATTCTAGALTTCEAGINATFVTQAAGACDLFNATNEEFTQTCFANPTCPCADIFARADLARYSSPFYFFELAECARAAPEGCLEEAVEFEAFANESLARDCAITESSLKTLFPIFAPCYIFCNGPTSAPTPLSLGSPAAAVDVAQPVLAAVLVIIGLLVY